MKPRIACCLLIVLTLTTRTKADAKLRPSQVSLEVGGAAKLQLSGGNAGEPRWTSSDPRIVEVFSNGYVIGLRAGSARVDAAGAHGDVTITQPRIALVDPSTLKQYPDNRVFEIDGRKCVGSELNGSRATDPD